MYIKNKWLHFFITHLMMLMIISLFSQLSFAESNSKINCSIEPLVSQYTETEKAVPLNKNQYWNIVTIVQNIHDQQQVLKYCLDDSRARLEEINTLFNGLKSTPVDMATYQDLQQEKLSIDTQIFNLGVLHYKLQLILKTADYIEELTNPFIITHHTAPIWKNFNPELFSSMTFSMANFYKQSGLDLIDKTHLLLLFIIVILSLFFSWILARIGSANITPKTSITRLVFSILKPWLPIILMLIFSEIYLYVLFVNVVFTPDLMLLPFILLIYTLIRVYIKTDVALSRRQIRGWPTPLTLYTIAVILILAVYNWMILAISHAITHIPLKLVELRFALYSLVGLRIIIDFITRDRTSPREQVHISLLNCIRTLSTIGLFIYIAAILFLEQNPPLALLEISYVALLTVYNLALLWVSLAIFKTPFFEHRVSKLVKKICHISLYCFFIVIIVLGWAGYHQLAGLVVINIITTFIAIAVVFEVNTLLKKCYSTLTDASNPYSIKLHKILRINLNDTLWELSGIRLLFMIPLAFITYCAVEQIWGTILYHTEETFYQLKTGSSFFVFTIYPVRIIRACFVFCILLLLGRSLASVISQRNRFKKNKVIQPIIKDLVYGAIVSVDFIFALIIAGINPASIMVIAGGLSFGIGFGVSRQIAGDLISGLYIMLHKLVKVGDHIAIEDTEGKVTKLSLMTTQIKTVNHFDLIISNSKLLHDTIKNYTFQSNKLYRMRMTVRIEDGRLFEKAQQIFLQTTTKIPEIIQDKPYQPNIFYELNNLTLWCEIDNVKKTQDVMSKLTRAVTQAFNENKIAFSFV